MARNLYRFYLYIVYITLLIFIAFAFGYILNTLLALTSLRGAYAGDAPDAKTVLQSVVFVVVASVIAGALAGLHYWLIRRDMQHDPAAGASAIRSFFLNLTEALGIASAVPVAGFFVLNARATSPQQNIVGSMAFSLATLALVVVLALERRRTQAGAGAALAFQRLHFYGVQILLLIFLTISWGSAIRPSVDILFFAGKGGATGNPLLLVLSVLWFLAFWLGYGWLVRNDTASLLRLILHFLSLAYGIGYMVYGLYQAFHVLFLFVFHIAPPFEDVVGSAGGYDFFSPFTLGLLVTGVYSVWLRMASRQGLIERQVLNLTGFAIATILSAGAFWWGCGLIIYSALQTWMPVPLAPDMSDWASAIALMVAGLGYIPLSVYQRRRNSSDPINAAGPRRGFVLALCGGGILALAIGGAVALYAWITALFGSPITYWQQVVHQGLGASIVGAILVAIYLSLALREHLFASPKRIVPVVPEPVVVPEPTTAPLTIETILDELLAGTIARDEAVARIRALEKSV
ncbi:MAG: hypothetical protein H0V70_06755 [Ktedonobacteraceae bacterium]|nr:hypothetical protein [Ktedonobacteraceae bacterium]